MKTKLKLSFTFCITICVMALNAQVGINILSPHPSAALQINNPSAINKGLLTPSMTSLQRVAILGPADGLIVYDTDYKMHFLYTSGSNKWTSMSPFTLSTPANTATPSNNITTPATMSTTAFNVGINTQNPTQALHVVGNSTVSGNTAVGGSLDVNGFSNNALVPTGGIIMWSGTTAPSGWGLCNGTVYTTGAGTITSPDLRGRFIVAAGTNSAPAVGDINPNYTPGMVGGENTHTLTLAQLPKHRHVIDNATDGANVTISSTTVQDDITGFMPCGSGLQNLGNGGGGNLSNFCDNAKSHSHSISGNSGDGTTGGLNNQAHENRPPYYVLAFIIKLP